MRTTDLTFPLKVSVSGIFFSSISLSTCPGDQWPVWPHSPSALGDGLALTQIWGEMRDQRPGLITPVTGVTITWHRVKTDKTNLSKISNILKFFTQKKTWTASVRQLAVWSVQCGVQVELCYFIDIKIVLCEDKATVQNYCHILAQKSHDKMFFLVSCFVAHSVWAGKHKISISRIEFLFLIRLFKKEFKGWELLNFTEKVLIKTLNCGAK